MAVPFVTRNPTAEEVERLRLALSTFTDGSGMLSRPDGKSAPGWRDVERAVADVLGGVGTEDKGVFDVYIPDPDRPGVDYGLSIKTKQLSNFGDLSSTGRVYMELSNSPAKLWAPLISKGIKEDSFAKREHADIIGPTLVATVTSWHNEAHAEHPTRYPGRTLDLAGSIYLVLSYSKAAKYQWHSFSLALPTNSIWSFRSARSVKGNDGNVPTETVIDWYGMSGGQLKYYPRASAALFSSPVFKLEQAEATSLSAKAGRLWPGPWRKTGGDLGPAAASIAYDLGKLGKVEPYVDRADLLDKAAEALVDGSAVAEITSTAMKN